MKHAMNTTKTPSCMTLLGRALSPRYHLSLTLSYDYVQGRKGVEVEHFSDDCGFEVFGFGYGLIVGIEPKAVLVAA